MYKWVLTHKHVRNLKKQWYCFLYYPEHNFIKYRFLREVLQPLRKHTRILKEFKYCIPDLMKSKQTSENESDWLTNVNPSTVNTNYCMNVHCVYYIIVNCESFWHPWIFLNRQIVFQTAVWDFCRTLLRVSVIYFLFLQVCFYLAMSSFQCITYFFYIFTWYYWLYNSKIALRLLYMCLTLIKELWLKDVTEPPNNIQ